MVTNWRHYIKFFENVKYFPEITANIEHNERFCFITLCQPHRNIPRIFLHIRLFSCDIVHFDLWRCPNYVTDNEIIYFFRYVTRNSSKIAPYPPIRAQNCASFSPFLHRKLFQKCYLTPDSFYAIVQVNMKAVMKTRPEGHPPERSLYGEMALCVKFGGYHF